MRVLGYHSVQNPLIEFRIRKGMPPGLMASWPNPLFCAAAEGQYYRRRSLARTEYVHAEPARLGGEARLASWKLSAEVRVGKEHRQIGRSRVRSLRVLESAEPPVSVDAVRNPVLRMQKVL